MKPSASLTGCVSHLDDALVYGDMWENHTWCLAGVSDQMKI